MATAITLRSSYTHVRGTESHLVAPPADVATSGRASDETIAHGALGIAHPSVDLGNERTVDLTLTITAVGESKPAALAIRLETSDDGTNWSFLGSLIQTGDRAKLGWTSATGTHRWRGLSGRHIRAISIVEGQRTVPAGEGPQLINGVWTVASIATAPGTAGASFTFAIAGTATGA